MQFNMCMNACARAYMCNIHIMCIYNHSMICEIYINLITILLKIIIKQYYVNNIISY